MNQEDLKGISEKRAFGRLLRHGVLTARRDSIRKGNPLKGEPDIMFIDSAGDQGAVEVMETCAPEFAAAIADSDRSADEIERTFEWGDDNVEAKVRQKLAKTYQVACPIDLLIYSDGRQGLADEAIAAKIDHVVAKEGFGPFRSVYFYGDLRENIWSWSV